MTFPLADQIEAVRREIALRTRVYQHWIEKGKMSAGKARHEIGAMKAVLETLLALQREREPELAAIAKTGV